MDAILGPTDAGPGSIERASDHEARRYHVRRVDKHASPRGSRAGRTRGRYHGFPMAEDRDTRALAVGKWLLAAVVSTSGLALGSIPAEVLVVMSALSAVACALLWMAPATVPGTAGWILLAFALLTGMTIMQILPLPAGLADALTPANAESWARVLAPMREPGPAWHSLSLAPAATRVEVVRGFFYGCVFLAALRVTALENGRKFLVRVVVFATGAMALATLAHLAVGAERVFGIYAPREAYAYRAGHLAPLLNLNHLAAYLNIGACVALGALIDGRAMPRALAACAALVVAATSVWQGSRGATATLVLGLVAIGALSSVAKKRRSTSGARSDRSTRSVRIAGVIVAVSVLLSSIALSDVARGRLANTDLVKIEVAKSALRLFADSPWFGVGRGAFESVFWAVREGDRYVTFTHPENLVAQWLVEWGAPVSLAAAALVAWALRPRNVVQAERPAYGAWIGILVTVLHDLVDFHLEVPGVVALVAVCAAVVIGGRTSSRAARTSDVRGVARCVRFVAFASAGTTVIALVAMAGDVGHSLAEDRQHVGAMAVDKTISATEFRTALRAAMLRYPREPYFPLAGAVRAQQTEDPAVIAYIGRALELNPHFGRAHLLLARTLAQRNPAQARLEYRLAFENDAALRDRVTEAIRLVVGTDSALELVPAGDAGVELLEQIIVHVAPRLPSTAVALDAEIERRVQTAKGPVRRRIAAALSDARDEAVWCADNRCLAAALRDAEVLAEREPTKCKSQLLLADVRVAMGEPQRAADNLEGALDLVVDRTSCRRELVSLLFRTGQNRRGDVALAQIVRAGCGTSTECIEQYTWAARLEESRGQFASAVRLYKRVLDIAPDRDDLLEHIGELGGQHGVMADSIDAYGILARRHPSDPRWPARIAELRARAAPPPALRTP